MEPHGNRVRLYFSGVPEKAMGILFRLALCVPGLGTAEQPGPHVFGHGAEPGVGDCLTISHAYMSTFMPHDVIHRWLILGFISHGSEGVPQGVKPPSLPAVDLQTAQELGDLLRQG